MLADARTMNAHVVENSCELSAFMKGGVMAAGSERDAGFCSGGDEDDNMSGLHSPSASEDSVEVQVTPISLRNKRKLAEPRKIQEPNTAPLKKRRFELIERTSTTTKTTTSPVNVMDSVVQDDESRPVGSPSPSPFRPWSSPATSKIGVNNNNNNETKSSSERIADHPDDSQEGNATVSKASEEEMLRRHDENRWIEEENKRREEESRRRYEARIQQEVLTRLQESDLRHHRHHHRHQQQQQQQQQQQLQQHRPLSPISPQLLIPSSSSCSSVNSVHSHRRESRPQQRFEPPGPSSSGSISQVLPHPRLQEEPLSLVLRGESPRVPAHPAVNGSYDASQHSTVSYNLDDHALPHSSDNRHQDEQSHPSSDNDHTDHHTSSQTQQQQQQQQQQRNYKNMTRERRIEANARERTRVHTISAAFDTLRRAIPAYSHNQKLSKLSVLRIACSYIMTLSNIANTPEGEPTTSPSLGACIDLVSRTIQTEGKLRKKKDE